MKIKMDTDPDIKWYKKIAIAAGAVVLSPVLIVAVGVAAAVDAAKEPGRRREYAQSAYFRDLHRAYEKGIVYSDEYCFYNEAMAKNIDFELVRLKDFSYIVSCGGVYLFPWFGSLCYSDSEQCWLIGNDGDVYRLSDDLSYEQSRLLDKHRNMPMHILVKEADLLLRNELVSMSTSGDDARELLPEYITLCRDYVSALEKE